MATLRNTASGILVETDPPSIARATATGALVEVGEIAKARISSSGILVEIGPSEAVELAPGGAVLRQAVAAPATAAATSRGRPSRRSSGRSGTRPSSQQANAGERQSILEADFEGIGYVQTRLWLGPRWERSDSATWYDWTTIPVGVAWTPAAVPDTTLGTTLDLSVPGAQIHLSDPTGWGGAGQLWVGPNGTGEGWAWIRYQNLDSGTGLADVIEYDVISAEHTGIHTAGAVITMFYELDTAAGGFEYVGTLTGDFSARTYRVTVGGDLAPWPILRNRHLAVVQYRDYDSVAEAFGDWLNFAVGWLIEPETSDDYRRLAEWTATFASANEIYGSRETEGLAVDDFSLTENQDTNTSSVLPTYTLADRDEYDSSQDTFEGDRAVDNETDTRWYSAGFVGENNPLPAAATPGGWNSQRGVDQFSISSFAGQGPGYRWISIGAQADTSLNADWLIAGYDFAVNFEGSGVDIGAGEHLILAENPTLFSALHPEAQGTVLDLSDYGITNLNNAKHTISTGGATSGAYTLAVDIPGDGNPAYITAAIDYNASASAVQSAIEASPQIGGNNVRVHGDAASGYTVTFVNSRGSAEINLTLDGDGTAGGTGVVVTETQGGGFPTGAGLSGERIFDYLDPAGGLLRLYAAPVGQGQSQVAWGSWVGFNNWAPNWIGESIPAIGTGQVARMIYAGDGVNDNTADYWEVGDVRTPGYHITTDRKEWLMLRLRPMDLQLGAAMTAASPGVGETLNIVNTNEEASVNGLGSPVTLQIGTEQITATVSGSEATITQRGANGTVADEHGVGDPVWVLEGSTAVDAYPLSTLTFVRDAALPILRTFKVYGSLLENPRAPDDANYTDDWTILDNVSASAAATYTVTLGTPVRYRWVMIEVFEMSEMPGRVRIDEIEGEIAPGYLDSSMYIDASSVYTIASTILQRVGVPLSGLIDGGDTPTVGGFTTQRGPVWGTIVDLMEMTGCRADFARDGKLTVRKDPFWGAVGDPTEEAALDRDDISTIRFRRNRSWEVGQVVFEWLDVNGNEMGEVSFPAEAGDLGAVFRPGVRIYADETAAQAGAERLYYQQLRANEIFMELAVPAAAREAGQIIGVNWDFVSDHPALDRSLMLLSSGHSVRNYGWFHVISGIQVTREDEV